eukprot:5844874-Amphidinium_carterae.1
MHKATLRLKLQVFHHYKLLPHLRASEGDAIRQVVPKILSHVVFQSVRLWTADEWKGWCGTLEQHNRVPRRSVLPIHDSRQTQRKK